MQYTIGTLVELVSKANVRQVNDFKVNDLINLNINEDILKRRKLLKIRPGNIGHIVSMDKYCIEIEWENGITTCIIPQIDHIRPVTMPVRVYRRCHSLYMDDWELADWANMVHKCAGGNGKAFTPDMMKERLKGNHCSCGTNQDGYSLGVFELFPFISEEVRSGGKAYMVCKKCGCMSHL